jgi:GNAT superfamily N-acetyltransferase
VGVPLHLDRLSPEEGSRFRAIRLRALLEAPDAFGSTFEETAARPMEAWSTPLKDMPTFVGVNSGVDVGMVRCARDETQADTAWVLSMWVAPDVRRTGVGAALVDAVIAWARSSGIRRLLLDVADGNAPAIALYKRQGFEPNGEISRFPPPREHIGEHRLELRLP